MPSINKGVARNVHGLDGFMWLKPHKGGQLHLLFYPFCIPFSRFQWATPAKHSEDKDSPHRPPYSSKTLLVGV